MTSQAQRLPNELIERIMDEYAMNGCERKIILRASEGIWLEQNQNLLKLSQVCRSLRNKYLPQLWSTLCIDLATKEPTNNFISIISQHEQSYIKYVKSLKIFTKEYRNKRNWQAKWLRTNANKPFGVDVKKSCHPAKIIHQLIQSVIGQNVEQVDFFHYGLDSDDDPYCWSNCGHVFFHLRKLLPFWLCVCSSRMVNCHTFDHLKNVLSSFKEERKDDWILKAIEGSQETFRLNKCIKAAILALKKDADLRKEVEKVFDCGFDVKTYKQQFQSLWYDNKKNC